MWAILDFDVATRCLMVTFLTPSCSNRLEWKPTSHLFLKISCSLDRWRGRGWSPPFSLWDIKGLAFVEGMNVSRCLSEQFKLCFTSRRDRVAADCKGWASQLPHQTLSACKEKSSLRRGHLQGSHLSDAHGILRPTSDEVELPELPQLDRPVRPGSAAHRLVEGVAASLAGGSTDPLRKRRTGTGSVKDPKVPRGTGEQRVVYFILWQQNGFCCWLRQAEFSLFLCLKTSISDT